LITSRTAEDELLENRLRLLHGGILFKKNAARYKARRVGGKKAFWNLANRISMLCPERGRYGFWI